MTHPNFDQFDPELDLVIERVVDVPRELIWQAWTNPDYLKQWFVPAPWTIADCQIELRPGGMFYTVMRNPEGEEFPSYGCILDIAENEKLVFTDALQPGYRPSEKPFMMAIVTMEPHATGTKYTAVAKHLSPDTRQSHEAMGFYEGWGTTIDQMVALIKSW